MNESNQGHDPIERPAKVNELTAVAENDAREGGHGDVEIEPRARIHELTETQLADFEAHYDGSEPAARFADPEQQTPPTGPRASRSPMDEATEIHELAVRPAKVNELSAVQLSSFERQYDEDDRIGFEMSAETQAWSPAEAEAVWRWIGRARGTEGRRS